MRRVRRHKFLQISVLFLIYSIIQVISENSTQSSEKTESTEKVIETTKIETTTVLTTTKTPKKNLEKKKANSSNGLPCTPPAIQQVRYC